MSLDDLKLSIKDVVIAGSIIFSNLIISMSFIYGIKSDVRELQSDVRKVSSDISNINSDSKDIKKDDDIWRQTIQNNVNSNSTQLKLMDLRISNLEKK